MNTSHIWVATSQIMRLSPQVTGLGLRVRLGRLPIGTHPIRAIVERVRIILRSMFQLLVMLLGGMMVLAPGSPCRLCWNGQLPLLMTVMGTEYLTHVILIRMQMGLLMPAMKMSMGMEFLTNVILISNLCISQIATKISLMCREKRDGDTAGLNPLI